MILITGPKGFVGHKLMEHMKDVVPAPSMRGMNEEDVKRMVGESGADVIIHTAAISDIGACERDPEGSFHANVELPLFLARAAGGRKLICFSSDQVYCASKEEGPYTEDMVCPGNTYARHKLLMEEKVLDILPTAVMLRAEWMYDYNFTRANYIMQLLQAEKEVSFGSRQYRGITYLREVAEQMEAVIKLPGGSYNFGSETKQSMYEITEEFLSLLGKNITLKDAPIRHNLWMNCDKARQYGVDFSDCLTGLKRCASDYGLLNKEP